MPYKSDAQRRFMHARHPEIAARWDAEIHAKKKKGKVSKMSVKGEGWLKPVIAGTVAGGLANQFPRVQDIEREHRRKAKKKGQVKKMLLPTSDDPEFDQEAAQRAFDLVMKMDDDTAEVFTNIVVSDYFEETVEQNMGALQRHLDEVIAKQLAEVKRAHLRLVSKGMDSDQAVSYAQAIALISKAVEWEEHLHPRGTGGRFRTKITHNQTKELHPKTAATLLGVDTPTHHPHNADRKLKTGERIQFQDEYRQLADFLSSVNQSTGGTGNHEVLLHFQDKNGRQFTDKITGTVPPRDMLANPDLTLIGAEAKPTTLTAGGTAFGLAGALGTQMRPSEVGVVNRAAAQGGRFADQWTNAGEAQNSNKKLYDRTAAAGQFMYQVGPPGSKTQLAGKFAEIVGNAGPQAEMVIGPTARKTAYRYRGTEKTPDSELTSAYKQAIEQGKQSEGGGGGLNQMVARRKELAGRAPTWEERELGRRAVVQNLRETLPSQQLYALQLASGNTPPSEGVMINADGQLSTQAIGYADDHYVPFNLKHLKGLKGGEYIRTRSAGGLTAEDVYTGLVSGARQVTVTSRSGTFTMEFQPDFRGGRRHNDKARRMTRRYEQILDAVQSGQVERAQIPPEIKAQIARQVREENAGEGNVTIRNIIKEREKEYRADPELSDVDEMAARHLSIARGFEDNSPESKAFIRQRLNDLQRKKQVNWQLNGDGYEAALTALAEQFPYYIKVRSTVLDDEDKTSLERDKGYVEPGRNRPTAAQGQGLFGTEINRGLKREGLGASTASRADYQRGRFEHRVSPQTEGGGDTTPEGEKKSGEKADTKQFVHQVARGIKHREAADSLFDAMQSPMIGQETRDAYDWLKDRDQFNRMMETPEGPAAVDQLVEAMTPDMSKFPSAVQNAARAWKMSGTAIGDEKFVAGRYPPTPVTFTGPAYQKGGALEAQQAEFRRVNSAYGRSLKFGGNIGSLDESQLRQEHDALVGVLRAIRSNPELVQATNSQGAEVRRQIAAEFYDSQAPDAVATLMKSPEQIEHKMEHIQRMRSLKSVGAWPEGTDFQHTARAPSAALNQAQPAQGIFDQSGDIVDAEVVEEPANVTEKMRTQVDALARDARSRLVLKPEAQWTDADYELDSAVNDYMENTPEDTGGLTAAWENLFELRRRSD
jgi:hypothetical protein